MPRKTLSEYRSKHLVSEALGLPYVGWQLDTEHPLEPQVRDALDAAERLVVKVDEGIKGRFKKGLVLLDVLPTPGALALAATRLRDEGHRWLLVEPMVRHSASDERYLSMTGGRDGLVLAHTVHGGVDVEAHRHTLVHTAVDGGTDWGELESATGLARAHLQSLVELFGSRHMVLLEANPYVAGDVPRFLDLAVQVDDAGSYFVSDWTADDFRSPASRRPTPQERLVQDLAETSQASFKLDVLNPDGSIFLLLSGGGASIVVADEVYNNGQGDRLANYGEYSGNPNAEETYLYTRAVLQLLLDSRATPKILFVGGAVANFTDVANTFDGIIRALDEYGDALRNDHVKVFVRRGGPRQEVGLARIEAALRRLDLLGAVHSPAVPLTEALKEALKETV
jgi:ATP-citrate lyase beta-subunit